MSRYLVLSLGVPSHLKNILKMEINKILLDDSKSLKTNKKGSGVIVKKREYKDLIDSILRHHFNLTKVSCKI